MYTQVEDLERILVMNKLKYRKEIAIKELKNKRFDYYLPKHKLFIEFDGAQHHYPVEHFGGNDRYIQQVYDDAEKTMWCKHNNYKFLRLNHLMSMETMISLINDVIAMEITLNEEDMRLPHIDEWAELNLNQKDLYINELYKNYNKFLKNILGENYKLNEIMPFEDYILNYNDNIEYKGIIQYKNKYTKHYVNNDIVEKEKRLVNNLTENDIINLFIEELDNKKVFNYSYIPSKLIYNYFKIWLLNNNLNFNNKTSRKFNQNFNLKLRKMGYINDKVMRINAIKNNEFDIKLLMTDDDLNSNNYNKSNFYKLVNSNELTNCLINPNKILNDNNIIQNFINELEDQNILSNSHLPAKYMYEYYKKWVYENNTGSRSMRAMEFGTRFSKIIKKYGYNKVEKKRLQQITDDQFDRSLLNIELDESKLKNNKITIYINEDKLLNENNKNE